MIAPDAFYTNDTLPHLRDLLSRNPDLVDASPEVFAERLGADVWTVVCALEALTDADGAVLP